MISSPLITRMRAETLMQSSKGRIFTVIFRRRNDGKNGEKAGDLRAMNCRTGVKKNLQGGMSRYNPADYSLMTVFDMVKGDWRRVSLDTITEIRIMGKRYMVLEN